MTPCTANPRRRTVLPAILVLILSACLLARYASAEKRPASSSDYAEFQNSTLTGTTNTINVANVPVVTGSGVTYDNVTITFSVSSTGTLTVSSTKVVAAAQTQTNGFEAGNYQGPSTDPEYLITVDGPGVGSGGITEWSLLASGGASASMYPTTATWYVGPLNTSHPLYSRLHAAGITSTAYSYGTGSGTTDYEFWGNNSLLGFAQTGNGLTIVSFTNNGIDFSTPQSTIEYGLIPQ